MGWALVGIGFKGWAPYRFNWGPFQRADTDSPKAPAVRRKAEVWPARVWFRENLTIAAGSAHQRYWRRIAWCPLSGTWRGRAAMSAFDPKRTLAACDQGKSWLDFLSRRPAQSTSWPEKQIGALQSIVTAAGTAPAQLPGQPTPLTPTHQYRHPRQRKKRREKGSKMRKLPRAILDDDASVIWKQWQKADRKCAAQCRASDQRESQDQN